jgi:hypothetical protein
MAALRAAPPNRLQTESLASDPTGLTTSVRRRFLYRVRRGHPAAGTALLIPVSSGSRAELIARCCLTKVLFNKGAVYHEAAVVPAISALGLFTNRYPSASAPVDSTAGN